MDFQHILDLALASALGVISWIARTLYGKVTDNEAAIDAANLKIASLHETYVKRDDFKDHTDGLFIILRRIEDKLDRKADR